MSTTGSITTLLNSIEKLEKEPYTSGEILNYISELYSIINRLKVSTKKKSKHRSLESSIFKKKMFNRLNALERNIDEKIEVEEEYYTNEMEWRRAPMKKKLSFKEAQEFRQSDLNELAGDLQDEVQKQSDYDKDQRITEEMKRYIMINSLKTIKRKIQKARHIFNPTATRGPIKAHRGIYDPDDPDKGKRKLRL